MKFLLIFSLLFCLTGCIYQPSPSPGISLLQDAEESEGGDSSFSSSPSRRSSSSRRRRSSSSNNSSRNSSVSQAVDEINRLDDLNAESYRNTVAHIYSLDGECPSSPDVDTHINTHRTCVQQCITSGGDQTALETCFSNCNDVNSCGILHSIGSGVFLSSATVLTNHHVVEAAVEPYETTSPANKYYNIATTIENSSGGASLLNGVTWSDAADDIALTEFAPAFSNVDVPTLGRLSSLELLDELFTIGHPLDMRYTASLGYLSNKNCPEVATNCIIYSIPTFSGSSGSPIFDSNGHLVAIHAFSLLSRGEETPFGGGPHIDRIRALIDSNRRTQTQRLESQWNGHSRREQRAIASSVKEIVINLRGD